jgi:hypothetical protein
MDKTWLRLLCAGLLAAAAGCDTATHSSEDTKLAASGVGHVFVLILENENYATSFDPRGAAPYLANTLPSMGQLLRQYYGIGHVSLDNYVAMVSGQAPNAVTQSDCLFYADFVGAPVLDGDGQAIGQGCVYPAIVKTIGDQLQAAGLSWRGYMEDMGNDLGRDGSKTCSHPELNSQDQTQGAEAQDQYATRHNPFVYFHSVIDDQANCDARVVPLTELPGDLASLSRTPNYVFITPNLCHDGHDTGCANGEPGGLKSINQFLQKWVPMIMGSAAYQQDGLLIITFDEASPSDASSCCNEPTGPNTVAPGISGAGGGRVGAVLLSNLIKPGSVNDTPYNHYSMLRSVEDIFGVPHLGYAGRDGLQPFGPDVFGGS